MKIQSMALILILGACSFGGQKTVVEPVENRCDLSSVDTVLNGTEYTCIDIVDSDKTYGADYGDYTQAEYHLTERGEWAVSFDYGVIRGRSKCSGYWGDTNSKFDGVSSYFVAQLSELTSSEESARYCWCSMDGFSAKNGEDMNLSDSLWVFNGGYIVAPDCAISCAEACASNAKSQAPFRKVLFDVSR